MNTKYYKLVFVRWLDSCSPATIWSAKEGIADYTVSTVESVGWLLNENKARILIAQSISESEFGRLLAIPTQAILLLHTIIIPKAIKPLIAQEAT